MISNPIEEFKQEVKQNIKCIAEDKEFIQMSKEWINRASKLKYSYNYRWLGRPIIQHPEDILAMQELIWEIKPDLIIETGIAHGGSLIFSASMLELIGGDGQVLGLDIDIRKHNKVEIENHPMSKRITMIEGDCISKEVANQVYEFAKDKKKILLVLDSNHTHDHVLAELNLYSHLVTVGSYLIVFDTIVEELDEVAGRPWGKGNNPRTALWEFLKTNDRFIVDKDIENKLQITVAPDGYLKCIK